MASSRCSSIETLTCTALPRKLDRDDGDDRMVRFFDKGRVGLQLFERAKDGQRITVFDQAGDMEEQGLVAARQSFVEALPSRCEPRGFGDGDA
jgi:hypothetical protein